MIRQGYIFVFVCLGQFAISWVDGVGRVLRAALSRISSGNLALVKVVVVAVVVSMAVATFPTPEVEPREMLASAAMAPNRVLAAVVAMRAAM